MGSRRGLELWRHVHAQYKGVGPELIQRTVAEILTPKPASSMVELQPVLLKLKEQLRDITAAGHPLDETQRAIAPRGILPKSLHSLYERRARRACPGGPDGSVVRCL